MNSQKSVNKHKCMFCKEMKPKPVAQVEIQVMANLPELGWPHKLHRSTSRFFWSLQSKDDRTKSYKSTTKLLVFPCLSTHHLRLVHLELVLHCTTMNFLTSIEKFHAMRGYAMCMTGDNDTQLAGAAAELRKIVKRLDAKKLRELSSEK